MIKVIDQVDVVLAEDNRTVLLIAWASDDTQLVQSVVLPIEIEERHLLPASEWLKATRADGWLPIG